MRSAQEIRHLLREAVSALESAEKHAVTLFGEVLERNLYRQFGYSAIETYAEEELGFSQIKTAQFIRLATRLRDMPELQRAVSQGEVAWTTARSLVSVATPSTESAWLNVARTRSRRDVERTIRDARRSTARRRREAAGQMALPVDPAQNEESLPIPTVVTLRLSAEEFTVYERLVERLRKNGDSRSRESLMVAGLDALAHAGSSTEGAARASDTSNPYKIVAYLCASCKSAHTPTTRGDLPVEPAMLTALLDNADVVTPDGRISRAIPPRVRRRVLARDGHRCRARGCRHTSFLEVHHVRPRSRGGTNDDENLLTLCSACHRSLHDHPLDEDPSTYLQQVTRVLERKREWTSPDRSLSTRDGP